MKDKPRKVRAKLGEFDFRCPKCKTVHRRSSWSIAHMYACDQAYMCACGKVIELPRDERDR